MEWFEEHRPLMFGIAYRMLGTVMEAEDIVQEAYLRCRDTPPESIRSHRAFLSTIVTRLCLDHLKSAQMQREQYIGPWLPEPLVTEDSTLSTPAQRMSQLESISMAFLVLLEKLTPVERAVFLLREVFDYEYTEIAQIVDKGEATCRQLFSRAKRHVSAHRPRFEASPDEHERILRSFIQAVSSGELEALTSLLAEDAVVWSDGGGKVTAIRHPIRGRVPVARFIKAISKVGLANYTVEIIPVNGKLGLIVRQSQGGQPTFVLSLEIADGMIQVLRFVLNPDKLQRI